MNYSNKLLNIKSFKNQSSNEDIILLQKQNQESKDEISSLKKKIYAYKQMLKESEILLSIFREIQHPDTSLKNLNNAVDIDDVKIEELMDKVKLQIQF